MTDERETPRRPIRAKVQLKRSGAMSCSVRAYDLSETGCRIEFVEKPWLGERVWIKFQGLEALRSTVCWSSGRTTGLAFDRPIDSRVLEWLLTKLD